MPVTLIMDLTQEQGSDRVSQVQPPKNVWVRYFEIDLDEDRDALPALVMQNKKNSASGSEKRKIVFHDHNWTVELGDAKGPRPAILRMARTARNSYDYWIYRTNDPEYGHVDWILDNIPNPHHTHGRRWAAI